MLRVLIQTCVVLVAVVSVMAQQPSAASSRMILNPSKTPVYIEFVKTGKCKKDLSPFNFGDLCDSKVQNVQPFDAAWLRLVNNTRWAIGVRVAKGATGTNASPVTIDSTEFIDEDGQKAWLGKMVAKDAAEMDLVYESESETGCDFSRPAPKGDRCFWRDTTPPKIPLPAMSTDLFIAPGKSVTFPVDLAHVKQYVNLYVLYNFSWEYSGKSYSAVPTYRMQHRVYFGWYELGKAMAGEKERNKPRA